LTTTTTTTINNNDDHDNNNDDHDNNNDNGDATFMTITTTAPTMVGLRLLHVLCLLTVPHVRGRAEHLRTSRGRGSAGGQGPST
jgi:hypothetical protein